jgi:HK97 family phage major capsid protein
MADNMTPEEVIDRINDSITEKMQGTASKEEMEAIKADISAVKELTEKDNTLATEMKSSLADLEAKFSALKESAKKEDAPKLGLRDAIVKAYADNIEAIKEIKQKGGVMNLAVKAVGDMTITGNYSGGTVALSQLEQGVARIVRRKPFMRELVNSAGITSKYAVWIEQQNPEGGADMVGEGVAKPQADFDLVEASMAVKKVAAWIKVSKEMVDDLAFMRGEINNELIEIVELEMDSQILTGDGTGDNLQGLLSYAQAFTPATQFVAGVPNANILDVLRVAMAQIAGNNFEANYILMNPQDVAAMELTKSSTGEYTLPIFVPMADGVTRVMAVPVVANNGVAVGDYLVGDFTKSNLRLREDLNIQVGYINDDFTRNMMTVLCEARACHFVKSNHTGAFVKGTFATDIAVINKP